ncbi:unnamed protein product [Cladocopium goreaui]|uniref:Uncharacterized protein n=1 Tax=Cladocopium goreaui TaxID=2562237 RepID=A0A9P1FIJ6_9DINO|nr:unnamed protein product [Cladocopium goreaui]
MINVGPLEQDLDAEHLGGNLTWQLPEDLRYVSSCLGYQLRYLVYLAESAYGLQRSQLGAELPSQRRFQEVPADTLRLSFNHFTVYAKSTLAEQTTPASLAFFDEFAMASNMSFTDLDLDALEIGGNLSWEPPEDASEVTDYLIYLAEDAQGSNRSLVDVVPVGVHDVFIPAETPLASFTHLTVFARSSLVEQTTPMSLPIVDSVASVSEVNFTDLDLDSGDLGGTLVWNLPTNDLELVDSYSVYFATSFSGSSRSQLGGPQGPRSKALTLHADTAKLEFSHLLVYTESALVEQTTPVGVAISDLGVSASNLSFPDFDLDARELGGNLSWDPPEELDLVDSYQVYFAVVEDDSNSSDAALTFVERRFLGTVLSGALTEFVIPPETALSNFTHLLVYASSPLAEQTTPASLAILDVSASASHLNFTDEDLDEAELGGNLTWFEPQNHYGRLVSYRIYLQSGELRENLDEVLQGTVAIPAETQQSGYSHFSVYTVSALTEQTTPAMLLIDDTVARASNLSFEDLDLDLRELGGNLTWQEPEDMSQVTSYAVYFAEALGVNDTDCVVLGHVVALVTGSFEMDLDGASEEQVTEAATLALASSLNLDPSQIIVTVSAARRMEEVETRRLLATHWKVSYTAVVDVELASDVEQVVEAVSADQTAFSERMKTELVVTGVPPGTVALG